MILLASLAAFALDPAPGQPSAQPARPAAPGMIIAATPAVPPGAPMREVCRRERTAGSNLSQRVCRMVPVNSSARDRSAGDRLRESQGARMPEGI